MQLTETVKIYPTKYQRDLITKAMTEYITTVNSLVFDGSIGHSIVKTTTADVCADLPSAILNQCIRDARSILNKHYKYCHSAVINNRHLANRNSDIRVKAPNLPILRKPCFYVNNQNYKFKDNNIEFPLKIDGKSKRISVLTKLTQRQKNLFLNQKLGTMRIVVKGYTLVAQIVYEVDTLDVKINGNVMGVDLGIKCPAVSYCSDKSVKFHGNGRKNKYIRRHYASVRKKLQRAKKRKAIKRIKNKEQRVMRDIDHKLSRDIVNTAMAHNVSLIKLERLQNIRSSTRQSRKNNKNLHSWPFYRLAQFIEYKAKLVGISVEYVNPAYTSQKCPICGDVHHAKDRTYTCKCGFSTHRDLLGAINICNSTEFAGNRQTA